MRSPSATSANALERSGARGAAVTAALGLALPDAAALTLAPPPSTPGLAADALPSSPHPAAAHASTTTPSLPIVRITILRPRR